MRGKNNAKLTYEQREQIHYQLHSIRRMYAWDKRIAEQVADECSMEVGKLRKIFAAERAAYIDYLARKYGVRKNSIPTIARRFKEVSPHSPAILARISKRQ